MPLKLSQIRKKEGPKLKKTHLSNQNITKNIYEDVTIVLDDGKQKKTHKNYCNIQNIHKNISEDVTIVLDDRQQKTVQKIVFMYWKEN